MTRTAVRCGLSRLECEVVFYGISVEDTRHPDFRAWYSATHRERLMHWETARAISAEWKEPRREQAQRS